MPRVTSKYMLISQGELMFGESEEECAERWRAYYGVPRSLTLAEVFAKTATSRPMSAFWRRVGDYLGQFAEPRANQSHLKKEFENRGHGRTGGRGGKPGRSGKRGGALFELPANNSRN